MLKRLRPFKRAADAASEPAADRHEGAGTTPGRPTPTEAATGAHDMREGGASASTIGADGGGADDPAAGDAGTIALSDADLSDGAPSDGDLHAVALRAEASDGLDRSPVDLNAAWGDNPGAAEQDDLSRTGPGEADGGGSALPRVPLRPGQLAAWNALASYQDRPIVAGDLRITFSLTRPLAAERTEAQVFRGTHGPVRIAVTGAPVADLFGAAFDAGALGALPPALAEAVRRGLFDALRARLPAPLGAALSADFTGLARPHPDEMTVAVEIGGAFSAPLCLILAAPPAVLLALAGVDDLVPLARHPEIGAAIPYPAALRLGTADLPLADVRELEPGDVVLCPPAVHRDAVELILAGRIVPLARSAAGWTAGASRMADPTPSPTADDREGPGAESFAELPVRIAFHIGEVMLPLSAVEALAEGAILPLEAVSVDAVPVRVRANGTVIAEGDLVQLDNRLGVRLARVGVRREP